MAKIRMNSTKTCVEDYECPSCGWTFPIYRRQCKKKATGHRKWLYCVKCKKKINFLKKEIEMPYDKYEKPPVQVRCGSCDTSFDEDKVEFLNIEEDMQGRDVLTFTCPSCNKTKKSWRFG